MLCAISVKALKYNDMLEHRLIQHKIDIDAPGKEKSHNITKAHNDNQSV